MSAQAPQELVVPAAQRRRLPRTAAIGLSAVSGLAALLSFPPYDLWWLAPVAVAALALAVHRRGFWTGAGLGLLSGLVFFVPLLAWTALHVDIAPWLILSAAEAAYLALLGGLAASASTLVDRFWWAWPVVTGLLWTGQEALRDRTPFGGFPWGRLAFSQADSPLVRLAALAGAPLVTFAVAAAGGLLAGAMLAKLTRRSWALVAGLAGGAVALVLVGYAVPLARPGGAPVTVAIVQGNVPRMGLDFNAQRRAVLDNHVNATIALADRVAAGTSPRPDLVVWPENASDIDPLRNADAAARIDQAAQAIDVPILVGAVLFGSTEGRVRNVGIVWDPDGGPGQTYDKRHPVPFAEYMPWRPLIAPIAGWITDEAALLRNDFTPGDQPGVLTVGPAVLGDVICFEVAYDEVVRDAVNGGAQLLAVQTNNATFDEAEARQQLAMVRLRAVEHGRDSLMASTVGVSGFVTADGAVHDATGFNEQAVVVQALQLGSGRTLATRLGVWPEVVLAFAAVLVVAAAGVIRRRERRGEDTEGTG